MEHLIHFIKDLKLTGAIAPSSKFLAKDLVIPLKKDVSNDRCKPLKILEIGAGTGPLTKQIARLLRPQDQMDIVEIHEHFFKVIQKKFNRPNIRVHHTDVLNFKPDEQYDYIFSSLPYENMPVEISKNIWKKKLSLCCTGSCICYFKYVKIRNFKCEFEKQIVNEFARHKKIVFLNLPPAKIYTLKIDRELQPATGTFFTNYSVA